MSETPPRIADAVRDFAERLADYMLTRNTPWRDEVVMREAVREVVLLIFGDALYETRQILAAHSDGQVSDGH